MAEKLPSTYFIDKRTESGYNDENIVMVYSGSSSGWQSFKSLQDILGKILASDQNFKLLFLAPDDPIIEDMKKEYPGQVSRNWVSPDAVFDILAACDFGILFRDNTITNNVASPTKFAEYLASGLSVIISSSIMDYAKFVKKHNCGMVIENNEVKDLYKPGVEEKMINSDLALNKLSKDSFKKEYQTVIDFINK